MCYSIVTKLCNQLTKIMDELITYECYNTIHGKKFLIEINHDVTIYYSSKGGYHFDILDHGFSFKYCEIQDVISYIVNYVI